MTLIQQKIKYCVTVLKTYPNRAIKMEVNRHGKDSITMINAYATTSRAEEEKVEQFYYDIERTMADSNSKQKIITGYFNVITGTKTKEDFNSVGAFWNRGEK